jgi:polyisoprenoid-binding protein YceI
MKKVVFLSAILAASVLVSCGGSEATKTEASGEAAQATADAVTYKLDSAASKVEWFASKITGKHNGTIPLKGGELKAEGAKLTAGAFSIDVKSLKVVDITDAKSNGDLTGHLNSPDFFNTAEHPEAKFEIISVEAIENAAAGAANYNVKGNLTIKGITKAVTFPATIAMDATQLTANAEFDIDRTEWDIKFGSGKFFPNLKDKAINDNFKIKLALVAKA